MTAVGDRWVGRAEETPVASRQATAASSRTAAIAKASRLREAARCIALSVGRTAPRLERRRQSAGLVLDRLDRCMRLSGEIGVGELDPRRQLDVEVVRGVEASP